MIRRLPIALAALTAVLLLAGRPAHAAMRFTEWLYSGNDGEFMELTNVGGLPIDMTGWSYDDNSRAPGSFSLTGFGVVQPGESVIISEPAAATFRTSWGLSASVKVLGDNDQNIGRSDEINIYDASSALVDRLTYGDQDFPGTIRTQNVSGNPIAFSDLGDNNVARWVLSVNGDSYGSYVGAAGDIGNPGIFTLVPEPTALALTAIGLASLMRRRRGS